MKKIRPTWRTLPHEHNIPKHEKEFVISMLDMIEDEAVRMRLSNLIIWYIDKAGSNKRWYYMLSAAALGANLLIPVVNVLDSVAWFSDPKVCSIVLAAVASGALSVNGLGHFKDNWTRYRKSAELVKELMTEYVAQTQECAKWCADKTDCQEASCLSSSVGHQRRLKKELFEKLESHITEEIGEWEKTVRRDVEDGKRQKNKQ